MDNIKTKKTRRGEVIPYCFDEISAAKAAVTAVLEKYDNKISAYSIGKVLYVQSHTSKLMNFDIRAFVRSLGGVDA